MANNRKGAANPNPSPKKIARAENAGSTAAAPRAAPIKGPVHGAATKTASTPVANEELLLLVQASRISRVPNSKLPRKLNAINQNRITSPSTTIGDCNWKPQPMAAPPARKSRKTKPRAVNVVNTPAV